MINTLPIDLTIVFSAQHLQDVAFELGKRLQAKQILSVEKALFSQFHSAIVFLVDHESDLSTIWQLVAIGITTIPILFVIDDKLWQPDSVNKAIFLDRPSIAEFSDACDANSAVFLSSHGRSDTISLRDGKLCGANFHEPLFRFTQVMHSDQIVPNCIKTGHCYRPDITITSLNETIPRVLFTNACESFSWGKDSAVGSKWSFHNAAISNGIESLVGTPFVRNSLSQEIELASKLFKAGLPLWQVVHIINSSSQRIGLDTCGLIIRGNPLIHIDKARAIECVDLVFDKNGTTVIDIPANAQVTKLVFPPKAHLDLIISQKGKLLYAFAPSIPKSQEEIWVAGNGVAEILLDSNEKAVKEGLRRELRASKAWNELETFIPLTARESGLRNRWKDIISNTQNLTLPASIDSLVAMKMQQRIKTAEEARSNLECKFVERLMEQVKKKTPQCPIDLSRTRLIFANRTEKAICPACSRYAIEMHFEYSWKTIRCPRCGTVSLNNGAKLIQAISLPKQLFGGEEIEINFEVSCETFSAAIYRGDHEGISLEKLNIYNWMMRIDKNVPPHFYYLRVYAVNEGVFEAAHRIIEVSCTT